MDFGDSLALRWYCIGTTLVRPGCSSGAIVVHHSCCNGTALHVCCNYHGLVLHRHSPGTVLLPHWRNIGSVLALHPRLLKQSHKRIATCKLQPQVPFIVSFVPYLGPIPMCSRIVDMTCPFKERDRAMNTDTYSTVLHRRGPLLPWTGTGRSTSPMRSGCRSA